MRRISGPFALKSGFERAVILDGKDLSDSSEDFLADRTRTSSDDAALWRRFRGVSG